MSLSSPSLFKCLYLIDMMFMWRSMGALWRIRLARTSHAMAVTQNVENIASLTIKSGADLGRSFHHNPRDCDSHPTCTAAALVKGSKGATRGQ